MAMFSQERELTELEIVAMCAKIERVEGASNVSFLKNNNAFYVFQGIVSNKPVMFNLDKKTGFILTEEE
ncbi:hypothetical protein G9F72_019355 [Clostridium estertheticum]|uniref:hypothetical protein n=1 Tax=Clostridium estertheticum TaxID=238834 RepID=UPI0013E95AF8|nr:hypothetical protein [Clostridium estertheticum]MBZ9688490.1 hypothetical protein [Clostridium estertheticum]